MFTPDYLQGDIHLGEHGMMTLVYKHFFDTIEEYEAEFIKRYNAKVKTDNKIVLFTGDLGRKDAIERVLPQLKGRKFLLLGNHDNYSRAFYEKYFEEVFSTPVWLGRRVVASHIPIPVEDGVLNIHSHTHWIKLDSKNHWNICPEWHNFTPILYKKVHNMLNKLEKPNYHFCMEWYKDIQLYEGPEVREDLVFTPVLSRKIDATSTLAKRYRDKIQKMRDVSEADQKALKDSRRKKYIDEEIF